MKFLTRNNLLLTWGFWIAVVFLILAYGYHVGWIPYLLAHDTYNITAGVVAVYLYGEYRVFRRTLSLNRSLTIYANVPPDLIKIRRHKFERTVDLTLLVELICAEIGNLLLTIGIVGTFIGLAVAIQKLSENGTAINGDNLAVMFKASSPQFCRPSWRLRSLKCCRIVEKSCFARPKRSWTEYYDICNVID